VQPVNQRCVLVAREKLADHLGGLGFLLTLYEATLRVAR
jgi:hypothetical protein